MKRPSSLLSLIGRHAKRKDHHSASLVHPSTSTQNQKLTKRTLSTAVQHYVTVTETSSATAHDHPCAAGFRTSSVLMLLAIEMPLGGGKAGTYVPTPTFPPYPG